MRPRSLAAVLIASVLVAGACSRSAAQIGAAPGPTPQQLAAVWDAEHVSPPESPLLTHAA